MSLTTKLGDAWQALKEGYQGFTEQELDTAWRDLRSNLYQKFITPTSVSDAIGTHFNPGNSTGFNKALTDKLCAHISDTNPRDDLRVYTAFYYDHVAFDGNIGTLEISDNRLDLFLTCFREAQADMPVLSKVCSAVDGALQSREDFRSGLRDAARSEKKKDEQRWAAHDQQMRDAQVWLKSARGGPL